MAEETIFFFLLLSGFLSAGVLAILCLRNYLRLRYAGRRLRLTEARLGRYRRRLAGLRGRMISGGGSWDPVVPESRGRGREDEIGDDPPAELRLRLQQGPQRASGTVERYRLVASMVRRGLSADDISAILQLSPDETEQLVKLARVGRTAEKVD